MPTSSEVLKALEQVIDPELGVDIVNLGLVYRVEVNDDGLVDVEMTLTTPGCPLSGSLPEAARHVARTVPGVKDANVRLVWNPQWHPGMMSQAARTRLGYRG